MAFGFSPLWLLAGASDVLHGTRVYLDELVRRAEARGRARGGVGLRDGRRPARRARGHLGRRGAADRHPAARGLGAEGDARRAARRRRLAAERRGARAPVPRPARRGRARAAEPARGLDRDRARVRRLGALGRRAARRGAVPGGLAAAPRRGLRRVPAPRLGPVQPRDRAATSTRRTPRSPSAGSPSCSSASPRSREPKQLPRRSHRSTDEFRRRRCVTRTYGPNDKEADRWTSSSSSCSIPVTDVDRAKAFYEQQVRLQRSTSTTRAGDDFRVVQMTPPGSACSITFGDRASRRPSPGRHAACTSSSPTSRRRAPS